MPISKKFSWMPGVVLRLIPRVLDGTVSAPELIGFIRSRIHGYTPPFRLAGIEFDFPDYNAWHQSMAIFFLGEYAEGGFDVQRGDVVVDIGANRGIFTAYAASKQAGTIVSFEPDGNNFAVLDRLIRDNGLPAAARNAAVCAASGKVRLYKAINHTRHSLASRDVLTGDALERFDLVDAISLDDALGDLSRIDLLKIDCEGCEFDIMAAAGPSALNKIDKIIMEYHCRAESPKIATLTAMLEGVGFLVEQSPKPGTPLGMLFARKT